MGFEGAREMRLVHVQRLAGRRRAGPRRRGLGPVALAAAVLTAAALVGGTSYPAHAGTSAPFGGTPAAVPGTVQAANYDTGGQGVAYNATSTNGSANSYRSDGIDLEDTTDTQDTSPAGGAYDLGWTTTGQWFNYTVDVASAGTYTVSVRLASPDGVTDALHIANSAGTSLSGAVAAPETGGWQDWTTVTASVTLPAGVQTLTIDQDNAGWNIHFLTFTAAGTSAPFGGTPAAVPGTVQAANYDTGGQGVAYNATSTNGSANSYRSDGIDLEDTTDTQDTSPAGGAYDLGWTTTGQWFNYTVDVASAGTYTVSVRLASPDGVTDALHIANSAGTSLSGAVAAPETGGWQDWSTVTASVTLPAGVQTLTIDQDNAGWNIHFLTFTVAVSAPNLGPNVYVFNTSMSTTTIQNDINQVYSTQQSNQFGTQRYELMFEPGTYDVSVPVGFYTEVVGLGQSPTQTVITGGGIYANAAWNDGNATENFWRGVENITIDPSSGSTEWAVSQAAPMRRVDIEGNLVLDDDTSGNTTSNWSSGGFISDSIVTGQVNSGTQQQFLMRNDQLGSWTGSNWNMVFVGSTGVPGQSFPSPPDTTVSQTPTVDEKPYLYIDSSGNWDVFVPSNRTSAQGVSWASGNTPGTSLPISDFYIATPSSTVAQINAALAGGQDLLFTPGVYQVNGTIDVTNPDTVVLGLGLATLVSNGGDTILQTADVNGIRIGGLIFDAGSTNSPVLE